MFPLVGFEANKNTKFSKTPQTFEYTGSLKDAYSQLEMIEYISFKESTEKKGHSSEGHSKRKQKKNNSKNE